MVVLVRHDDKQRIGLVDAFRFETAEEVAKGLVVSLERRDIARLARTIGMAAVRVAGTRIRNVQMVRIMRIGNISVDDWNAGFEHFCGIA